MTLGAKPRARTARRAWRGGLRLPHHVQPALERYARRLASAQGAACSGSALLETGDEVAAKSGSGPSPWLEERANNSYYTDAAGPGQPDLMAQPFGQRRRGFGENGNQLLSARLTRPDLDHGARFPQTAAPGRRLTPHPAAQGSSRAWTASTSSPATRRW